MSVRVHPRVLYAIIKPVSRWVLSPRASVAQLRRRAELITRRPGSVPGVDIDQVTLGGVPAERHTPHGGAPDLALLYLHGGGFMACSPRSHRPIVAHLSRGLRATAYVPDYRLAPEHPFPAAIEDTVTAYRALLANGWPPSRIVVAGESAGGLLSLGLALTARDDDELPPPAALGLMCSGFDLTPESLSRLPRARRDPTLTPAVCARFRAAYVADADPTHPLLSPLHAELTGLPPLVIHTGAEDLIAAHSRELAERARAAGVTVRYREQADLGHGFQLMTGLLTQADNAADDLITDLRAALARHTTRQPRTDSKEFLDDPFTS